MCIYQYFNTFLCCWHLISVQIGEISGNFDILLTCWLERVKLNSIADTKYQTIQTSKLESLKIVLSPQVTLLPIPASSFLYLCHWVCQKMVIRGEYNMQDKLWNKNYDIFIIIYYSSVNSYSKKDITLHPKLHLVEL